MGNTCACYKGNKGICFVCNTKYCTKCLQDKHAINKHVHRTVCCNEQFNLENGSHDCSCMICGDKFSRAYRGGKLTCEKCTIECDSIRCSGCYHMKTKHEIHLCRCANCFQSTHLAANITVSICMNCLRKVCSIHGGTSTTTCETCDRK